MRRIFSALVVLLSLGVQAHAQDLCVSIDQNDLAGVRKALDEGAPVDSECPSGLKVSAFARAAVSKRFEIARLLLDRGANPSFVNDFGRHSSYGTKSSFDVAVIQSSDLVQAFLDRGVDPNTIDRAAGLRYTPFVSAFYYGGEAAEKLRIIDLLIAHGLTPYQASDVESPLEFYLLPAFISTLTPELQSNVLARIAAWDFSRDPHAEGAKYFLRHALRNRLDIPFLQILIQATPGGLQAMNPTNDHPLVAYLSVGNANDGKFPARASTVSWIMDNGVSPKAPFNEVMFTALYMYMQPEALNTLKVLVDRGVDLEVTDDKGYTLLHDAIRNGGPETLGKVKILVEAGANVNHADAFGYTPLCSSRVYSIDGLASYLITHGATLGKCPF